MTWHCLDCSAPIDPNSLSFEQKLVDDKDFCRRCWARIMMDEEILLPRLAVA